MIIRRAPEQLDEIRKLWYSQRSGLPYYDLTIKASRESNWLENAIQETIMYCVPKQNRKGGKMNTQGVYKGKNPRTGKVIMGYNKSQAGTPDILYEFDFCPSFACEVKIKDSIREKQQEYIDFQHFDGRYKCVVRSYNDFIHHWSIFCEKFKDLFPSGSILVINNKYSLINKTHE